MCSVDLEDLYTSYVTGEAENPSLVVGVLPSHVVPPTSEGLCELLSASDLDVVSVTPHEKSPENPLDVEAVVGIPSDPAHTVAVRVGIGPSLDDFGDEVVATGVSEAERYAATRMTVWSVAVETTFRRGSPLADLQAQLAVLAAVAPAASVVLDLDAQRLWPGARARAAGRIPVAVPASELFTIQSVEHRRGLRWLHTHGLHRCGALEIEALDIAADTADATEMLLWAAAMRFAEQGTPPPYHRFEIGPDVHLAWLPWQDALEQVAVRGHGRLDERDELHRRPSAVLVAAVTETDGSTGFAPLGIHAPAVRAGVPLYVSFTELERRALAAAGTIAELAGLVAAHRSDPRWTFLAEVGIPGPDGEVREVVVVDVTAVGTDLVTGIMRAAPLATEGLSQGDSTTQPADRLVGWRALGPTGTITQDDALYA